MTKKDPKDLVTNKVLDEILGEAVDTILKGMDNMFKKERKFNSRTFATKVDLNREVSWLRDDIKGLTADLSGVFPRRKSLTSLRERLTSIWLLRNVITIAP